jgi:hypothetical protein
MGRDEAGRFFLVNHLGIASPKSRDAGELDRLREKSDDPRFIITHELFVLQYSTHVAEEIRIISIVPGIDIPATGQ